MRLRLLLILAALAPFAAHAAPARLTEADVRAFVERQSKAWNAGDLAAYFALYAPGATFTDQGRAKDGRTALYGVSTLPQARAQARRSLRGATVRETTTLRAIRLAPDGRGAVVTSAEDTVITKAGHARRSCAERTQTLVATSAGLRSKGQTDTVVFCR
jgi:uncharacterized protein (TIGR02246 family)